MMEKVLFIVVTYNAMRWLDRCIQSVDNTSVAHDIFVVDNGSTDGTQSYIETHYPNVFFKQSKSNLGFGKANNIGLDFAANNNYQYIYLLNQDAWVFPDTVKNLIDINKRHPEYGVLSPIQMEANLKRFDKDFQNGPCDRLSNKNFFSDLYTRNVKEVYSVTNVMAAHWLISRECLLKVGAFSPSFPHYGEDDNFLDRVLYHGFKIGIVPSTIAVHDREDRPMPHSKLQHMAYIGVIAKWSCLGKRKLGLSFGRVSLFLFKESLLRGSLKPIGYILKLLRKRKEIIRDRELSKSEGAFLNLK